MKQNKMGEGERGEPSGALFIFYFLMLGDAGTYLATKIPTNPARFPGGQPRNRGAAAGAAAEPSQRARSLCRLYHPARAGGGAGGGGAAPASRSASRRQNAISGEAEAAPAAAPPEAGGGAEGPGRAAGMACSARGTGEESRGRGFVDRTTTVLFAVLIPPVGSGGTKTGRVPGICPLPRSRRECQGHGEGELGAEGEGRGPSRDGLGGVVIAESGEF